MTRKRFMQLVELLEGVAIIALFVGLAFVVFA
jgi:hypothetical protein